MKERFVLVVALLLVLSASILAQGFETLQLVDPGITPDSFFYGADLALENIGLALTFSNDVKIESKINNAEERLSEVRMMALENKVEEMTEAKERLEKTS